MAYFLWAFPALAFTAALFVEREPRNGKIAHFTPVPLPPNEQAFGRACSVVRSWLLAMRGLMQLDG
jgi:hypothetical protein